MGCNVASRRGAKPANGTAGTAVPAGLPARHAPRAADEAGFDLASLCFYEGFLRARGGPPLAPVVTGYWCKVSPCRIHLLLPPFPWSPGGRKRRRVRHRPARPRPSPICLALPTTQRIPASPPTPHRERRARQPRVPAAAKPSRPPCRLWSFLRRRRNSRTAALPPPHRVTMPAISHPAIGSRRSAMRRRTRYPKAKCRRRNLKPRSVSRGSSALCRRLPAAGRRRRPPSRRADQSRRKGLRVPSRLPALPSPMPRQIPPRNLPRHRRRPPQAPSHPAREARQRRLCPILPRSIPLHRQRWRMLRLRRPQPRARQ